MGGGTSMAGAGGGLASDKGARVAFGLASLKTDALDAVAVNAHERNAATITRLRVGREVVTLQW